jgi:GT2 family glycosyltransferase
MSGPLESRLAKRTRQWALRFPSDAQLASFDGHFVSQVSHTDEEIVVVIVHFCAIEWCVETATSVLASEGIRIKVFVVDNSGSTELESLLPDGVTLVRNDSNLGYAGGANVILREWLSRPDSGGYVMVASHDLDVAPNAVAAMISVLAQDQAVGIVGPNGTHAREPRAAPAGRIGVTPVRWLNGSCLIFRRTCLEDVGLFEEGFGSYVEDVDICLRAWERNWAVVSCDDVIIATRGSSSTARDRLIARNSLLLASKRRGPAGVAIEALLQGIAVMLYAISYVVHARDPQRRQESSRGARLRLSGIWQGIRQMSSRERVTHR